MSLIKLDYKMFGISNIIENKMLPISAAVLINQM